jgi:hypothetical protein
MAAIMRRPRGLVEAATVTVNGPVKHAVEKWKLFVMDEDGKKHEMKIVMKTLRRPEQAGK